MRLLFLIPALAVALTGCVSIASESARQLDEIGDVELTTVICASRANAGVDCPASNYTELNGSGQYQVLIGYRLPAQSSPPESIAATDVPLTLSRSASYSAELARLAPPGAGRRWVGYVSPPFAYEALQSEQSATVVTRVMLLRGSDGSPFPSPFRHRTIVGFRRVGPEDDPNRPVSCGERLGTTHADENTSCMTHPGEDVMETDVQLQTRDLGVIAAAPASVPRGGSGEATFTIAYSGRAAAPPFAVAASTTIPGGTAAPAATSVAPAGAGSTPLPVSVSVPPSTPPGTYEVLLSASLPNGQVRRASALMTVTGSDPVDRTPPEVAMRMKSRPRIGRALHVGMVADISCSEACVLAAELRAGRRTARRLGVVPGPGRRGVAVVGAVAEKTHAAGRRNVRIRFTRGLGPRLKRMRRVALSLRVTARDRSGNVRRRTIGFSLRR